MVDQTDQSLDCRFLAAGRVWQADVGLPPFFRERKLCRFPTLPVFPSPPPLADPLPPILVGDLDENDEVAPISPAGFQQKCRVEHDSFDFRGPVGGIDLAAGGSLDPRVHDRLEIASRGGAVRFRAKDQLPERPPIDASLWSEDVAAKSAANRELNIVVVKRLVAQPVRIDEDKRATRHGGSRERALAAADAPDQADHHFATLQSRRNGGGRKTAHHASCLAPVRMLTASSHTLTVQMVS